MRLVGRLDMKSRIYVLVFMFGACAGYAGLWLGCPGGSQSGIRSGSADQKSGRDSENKSGVNIGPDNKAGRDVNWKTSSPESHVIVEATQARLKTMLNNRVEQLTWRMAGLVLGLEVLTRLEGWLRLCIRRRRNGPRRSPDSRGI